MRYDPLAMTVAASSSLLLLLAGEVHPAAAFAFGPPGGSSTCSGGCRSSLSVLPKQLGCCKPRRNGYGLRSSSSWQPTRFSCNPLLCATASDEDGASAGPRRGGRRKLSDEELEERKEQLRDLLRASAKEIDRLVAQNPSVLGGRDVVLAHRPKVALLQERLGISQKAAGELCLSANRLLSLSLETLESKIDWLQARLDLNKAQLQKIIERAPVILALSIENSLQPTLANIQSGLELSDEELTKLTVKTPDVLKNFSEEAEAIIPRIHLLQKILFLGEGDFATLRKKVIRRPELLFWPENRMLEVQKWMKDRFDFGDATIGKLCRNMPQLLTATIETLNERAKEIQEELSLDDKGLSKAISSVPNLLSQSVEDNIRPKMIFFLCTFALDAEEMKSLMLRYPILLRYSIKDNLDPKVQFYSKLSGEAVAKEAILVNPNLLIASLKTKLEPRLKEIEARGDKVRWTKTQLIRLATRTPALWEAYGLGDAPRGGGANSRKR